LISYLRTKYIEENMMQLLLLIFVIICNVGQHDSLIQFHALRIRNESLNVLQNRSAYKAKE